MSRRLYINRFIRDHQEADNYSDLSNENGAAPDSPSSGDDTKVTSSDTTEPSQKKSKKGAEKRVVSVPIGDVDGSRSKGEVFPPSDSWAWRKYGQKPIKGSPYPRGYYRCSSSKGCPARKQVERSRVDPTVLLITYSFDHNHPLPTSKHHHHHQHSTTIHGSSTTITTTSIANATVPSNDNSEEPQFPHLGDESLMGAEFGWMSDVASTSFLESTTCMGRDYLDADMDGPYGEEEDSLFADLEELPECSSVFRRFKRVESGGENRRCSLSAVPCMGNTG